MDKSPIKINISGSKSITNRILILCALSNQKILIKNIGICEDVICMIDSLKKLGIKILRKGNDLEITGNNGNFAKQNKKLIKLNTKNAGTTTRFLTALCVFCKNNILIDGNSRIKERPIKELTDALKNLGANIKTDNGYLPLKISPTVKTGGSIKIKGNISSQFISALLLTQFLSKQNTVINIEQKLYSRPYIEMTIKLLNQLGIKVLNKNFKQLMIKGNQVPKSQKIIKIEPDASSASYIGEFCAINKKSAIIENLNKNSIQGDIKFLDYLKKMGCKISNEKEGIKITGPKLLKPLGKIDFNETPDLVMTFAVLAMFAKGKTKICNIENLRIKESDRISALENEIKKFGIKVNTGKDFIEIQGSREILEKNHLSKITINTYNDHRIAMCFGVLRNLFPNMKIENPSCVKKSYVNFWNDTVKLNSI